MTDLYKRFAPLNSDSQCETEAVFFYDRKASLEAIYNNATSRIQAVSNLLINLYDYQNNHPSTLPSVAVVASYLLSDANSLLEELDPNILKIRAEDKINVLLEHKRLKALTATQNRLQ